MRLLIQTPRQGKTAALNWASREASGEILVFSDANSIYQADAQAAGTLLKVGESQPDNQLPPGELAAWTNLATMILNLDEAITKE